MDADFAMPILANALSFAFEKATTEGKVTIALLAIVSLFSWTVIIRKGRQLYRASKMSKRFYAAYRDTRDPLDLTRKDLQFPGAPAFEVYASGCEELDYHLKHNPVKFKGKTRISHASFASVKVALEREVSSEALALEKGMIILSTAVAGGPFIGLLGTVWGVMETFSGIAKVQAASLTAMAPGVAGALIATVVGLFVAIPAMFAYNYMVTMVRSITQELDNFASEYATAVEHAYVDNRSISDEIADALKNVRQTEMEEALA
jgi:biopolymer transport protein TolQ